jgi:hypothetical protein
LKSSVIPAKAWRRPGSTRAVDTGFRRHDKFLISEGDSREEALLRAEDVLESALAMYVEIALAALGLRLIVDVARAA